MNFEVELLMKNISIAELDELFLSTEIIDIIPDGRVKVGDKYVQVNRLAKYKSSFDGVDFIIKNQQLSSGIITILLRCEYAQNKFNSAKKFGNFISRFIRILDKKEYLFLSNGLSNYFTQRLYPKFQRYELILRKIFVLALSPEDKDFIKIIKKETNGKLDFSRFYTTKYVENLQIAELHALIFELNLNPVDNLSTHFKEFQSKDEYDLKEMISVALPITIWEKYFSDLIDSEREDVLKNSYDKIREYRNDIIHFHTISYRCYVKIDKLLSNAIIELEGLERNILLKWNFESARRLINDFSTQELFENVSKTMLMASEAIKPALNNISAMSTNISNALNSIKMPKINPALFTAFNKMSLALGQLSIPEGFDDTEDNENLAEE